MAGLYPPHHGVDPVDPPPFYPLSSQPLPSQPLPSQPLPSQPLPSQPPFPSYPGQLPPSVPYPKRSRRRLVVGALLAVTLVAAITAAIVLGVREGRSTPGSGLSGPTAMTAIQGYLDALSNMETDTITRNALCGIYEAVRDRRSDRALAQLSSEAFRKQFSRAEVTSIDKIVYWSSHQAQVLFTMRVVPAMGDAPRDEVQGIAQLLASDGRILVCSYVLRTAAIY